MVPEGGEVYQEGLIRHRKIEPLTLLTQGDQLMTHALGGRMAMARSSWQLTDQERRKACAAFVAVGASFLGAFAPVIMWGFDYLYDRRNLVFDAGGAPVQAIASDGSAVRLAALGQSAAGAQATLDVSTTLGDSARRLGLRNGDPVSMLVTGHTFAGPRSGLVIPARIGEQARVTVPAGSYSVTAFGSRQASLFSTMDPYQAAAGGTTAVNGNRQLALPLTARAPLLETLPPGPFVMRILGAQATRIVPQPAKPGCPYCGLDLGTRFLLRHILSCPSRPNPH